MLSKLGAGEAETGELFRQVELLRSQNTSIYWGDNHKPRALPID